MFCELIATSREEYEGDDRGKKQIGLKWFLIHFRTINLVSVDPRQSSEVKSPGKIPV